MPDRPNHGFMLRDGSTIVGVLVAIYAQRTVSGSIENFCNIASWSVLPEHRSRSLSLLLAVVSRPDFHYTDLSGTQLVAAILDGLGFETLPSRWTRVPNLPWSPWSRRTSIVTTPPEIRAMLSGESRAVFEDHHGVGTCRHLAIRDAGGVCHVV